MTTAKRAGLRRAVRPTPPDEPKPEPGESGSFVVDKVTRRVARPLLIALMSTSLAAAFLVVVRQIDPGRPWMTLTLLCFIAALEGAYTAAWLNNPKSQGVDRAVYRAAEALLLLVIARVVSWALFGDGIPGLSDIRTYLREPLRFLLAGGFITTGVAVFIAWGQAILLGRIFNQLDVSYYELRYYSQTPAERKATIDDQPIPTGRRELLGQYVRNWLGGGIAMVLLAALSTFEVREFLIEPNPLAITRLGLQPTMLVALLIYFLTGFWLLSHAQLLIANARWLMDGVAKKADMDRRWLRGGLAIILLVAFIAALLPIGSSAPIGRLIALALNAGFYLVGLIYSLVGLMFAAFLSLLSRGANEEIPPAQPEFPPPPVVPPVEPRPPNELFGIVMSSLFWTLLVVIIVGALLFFLRERGYRLEWAGVQAFWNRLKTWWETIRQNMSDQVGKAGKSLRRLFQTGDGRTAEPSGAAGRRWRFIRVNALSPREQVRYFYLSTVRRASEGGLPRRPAETPLEYVQDLQEGWPEAQQEIDELTRAFLKARYSPQEFAVEEVNPVKSGWKRIKSALRSHRAAGPSAGSADREPTQEQ